MSQFLLTQDLRHLPPWLILVVRQFDPNMKSSPTCATGSRCAIAHLPRPADDRRRKVGGRLAAAKVAVLASLRAATIAYSA